MAVSLSITQTQVFTALGNVLSTFGLVPTPPNLQCSIIRGQFNRVPEPQGTDFVTMWPLMQDRLSTNQSTWIDNQVTGSIGSGVLTVTDLLPGGTGQTSAEWVADADNVGNGSISNLATTASAPIGEYTIVIVSTSGGTTYKVTGPGNTNLGIGIVGVLFNAGVGLTFEVGASSTSYVVGDGFVITVAEASSVPVPGVVWGSGLSTSGVAIISQLSGQPGGLGTYSVPSAPNVGSETLYCGIQGIETDVEWTIQLDVHGPPGGNASDNTRRIETLWRDQFGVDACNSVGSGLIAPLFADTPRQHPFDNAEAQIEERWTIDLHLQVNPVVTVPQQFATEAQVTAESVESLAS
jgi:hypothetical protein